MGANAKAPGRKGMVGADAIPLALRMSHSNNHDDYNTKKEKISNWSGLYPERSSMDLRMAILFEKSLMKFSPIPLVKIKTIPREFFVEAHHNPIARHLCDNRSRGNNRDFLISFYDCFLRNRIRQAKSTVKQNV